MSDNTDDRDDRSAGEEQAAEMEGSLEERDDGDGYWYEPPEMTRRNAATWLAAAAGSVTVGSIAVSAVYGLSDASLASAGENDKIYTKGTYLVDTEGHRLQVDKALKRGSGKDMTVVPEQKETGKPVKKKKAVTILVRFTEDAYEKPTHLDWTVKGYVAYSMVCTHAGCLVSGRIGENNLYCPCHGSKYAPTKGAKVVGGPAPRPIPQLPIGVSKKGQLLIATGPFEGPIGPT